MGGEAILIVAAVLGGAMLLYLLYRSWQASTRAYALPTLVFSAGTGLWSAYGMPLHSYHIYFLIGFLIGAVVFCLHGRAIKALTEKG